MRQTAHFVHFLIFILFFLSETSAFGALSKSSLKARLKTEITAAFSPIAASDSALFDKMAAAIANAVVDEMQSNGTCLPGTFTTISGPVTGLGTVN